MLREITKLCLIRDRSVVRSSVIPSAKYCCSGSLLRLANGSTTIDRRGATRGCAIALGAAFAVIPGPAGTAASAGAGFVLHRATLPPLLLVSGVWALANASLAVVLGFAPPYFVAQGLSPAQAGGLTSVCLGVCVPITPFGGWLLARSTGTMPGILLCLLAVAMVPMLLSRRVRRTR